MTVNGHYEPRSIELYICGLCYEHFLLYETYCDCHFKTPGVSGRSEPVTLLCMIRASVSGFDIGQPDIYRGLGVYFFY